MRELLQLLLDLQTFRDIALFAFALVIAFVVYVYYRFRAHRNTLYGIVADGISCSTHQTVYADDAEDYFDYDLCVSKPKNIPAIERWLRAEIQRERSTRGQINRLAFVEKEGGPVGAISLKELISLRTGIPSLILRPGRKGPAPRIKFSHDSLYRSISRTGSSPTSRHILEGAAGRESVVLISDVATTGQTLLECVSMIEKAGGKVTAALVIYDRQELSASENGAVATVKDKLANRGIRLISMLTSDELRRAINDDPRIRSIAKERGLMPSTGVLGSAPSVNDRKG